MGQIGKAGMTNKIRNTLNRALRKLPPKYRGQKHKTAFAHVRAWAAGEYTSCLTYYSPVEMDEIPEGAIIVLIPHGWGRLGYICPYAK